MSNRNVIRNGAIEHDDWTVVPRPAADEAATLPAVSKLLVPLALWQQEKHALIARGEPLGVWIDSDEDPLVLGGDVHLFSIVAINFPAFKDGRGYSSAYLIRDRLKYRGELRAIGDVLRDQLFYMKRVGFNAFAVRADRDAADALKALNDFSDVYQGSIDQPLPLFKRRAQVFARGDLDAASARTPSPSIPLALNGGHPVPRGEREATAPQPIRPVVRGDSSLRQSPSPLTGEGLGRG